MNIYTRSTKTMLLRATPCAQSRRPNPSKLTTTEKAEIESPKNQTSAWPTVEQFWALLVQEPIVLRTWQFRGAGLKLQVSWFNSYTAVASTFGANRPLLACNVSPAKQVLSPAGRVGGSGKRRCGMLWIYTRKRPTCFSSFRRRPNLAIRDQEQISGRR